MKLNRLLCLFPNNNSPKNEFPGKKEQILCLTPRERILFVSILSGCRDVLWAPTYSGWRTIALISCESLESRWLNEVPWVGTEWTTVTYKGEHCNCSICSALQNWPLSLYQVLYQLVELLDPIEVFNFTTGLWYFLRAPHKVLIQNEHTLPINDYIIMRYWPSVRSRLLGIMSFFFALFMRISGDAP